MHTLVRIIFGHDALLTIFFCLMIIVGVLLAVCSTVAVGQHWRSRLPGYLNGPSSEFRWGPIVAGWAVGVVLAVGGLWWLLAPDARTAPDQAASAIGRLHGKVTRDAKARDKPITEVSFRDSKFKRPSLTDAELARLQPHLEALSELRELDLVRTDITDRGLLYLKGLTQLTTLQLGSTWGDCTLTRMGVDELRKALPRTQIFFYEPQPLVFP